MTAEKVWAGDSYDYAPSKEHSTPGMLVTYNTFIDYIVEHYYEYSIIHQWLLDISINYYILLWSVI